METQIEPAGSCKPTPPATQPEYRDVPGFPGYRVGSDGTVWSCKERIKRPGLNRIAYELSDRWHTVTGNTNEKGYLSVCLYCGAAGNRKVSVRFVHRIVLEAFIGPRPKGMGARHFPDRNPANNRLENLSWGTSKQNRDDMIVHGTVLFGEKNHNRKLNDKLVQRIRSIAATESRTKQSIASEFQLSVSTVSRAIRRETWTHI